MRKVLYALTIAGLVSIGLLAQQSGGAFIPSFAYDISGAWNFSGTVPTLTGNGSVVGTTATQTLTNKTLTSPTLTTPVVTQPTLRELSEIVTAANVLTSADCGATFYLNASAGFLSTLPSPTSLAGCYFRFVVHTATSSNGYTIGTPTADIIDGMVVGRDGNAGVACSNEDLITLVNAQMVGADWVELRTDGTNWYVSGIVDIAAGFTCTVT